MDKISEKVAHYILRHNLISSSESEVIIGLSGGADSIALISILRNLGYKVTAAHCNFHLRGAESNRDEEFVTRYCQRSGIKIVKQDFTIESDGCESVEMKCRRLRYEWFYELRESIPGSIIAVAHHIDDNIETLLLNLLRGSGITGMRAMLPRNEAGIIRPLLCITRREIEEYLASAGAEYVTDSTNLADDNYKRNMLRNGVIPTLAARFPDYRCGITASISNLRDDCNLLEELSARAIQPYITPDGNIELAKMVQKEGEYAGALLYRFLRREGLTRSQADDILRAHSTSGKRFICANGSIFYTDRGRLCRNYCCDIEITTEVIDASEMRPDRTANAAYFDADKIGNDFTFRKWREGDRMQPYGMGGRSKKLSDLFSDAKIPLSQKSHIPIMVKGNEILWIPGVRASMLYPVTEATRRVLKVSMKKN